jgi:hypothetical protein
MKPLVHWAIHHQVKLRMGGRSAAEVWGRLAAPDGSTTPFRYDLDSMLLTIDPDGEPRTIRLDDYGFERSQDSK